MKRKSSWTDLKTKRKNNNKLLFERSREYLKRWGVIFLVLEIVFLVSLILDLKAFYPVASANLLNHKKPARIKLSIPILMYHHIRSYNNPQDAIGTALSVSPSKLDNQLKTLKDRGYQTISLSDFISHRYNRAFWRDKPKPIILTFDDGYLDNYENAFSILKKYDFTGTFFLITNYNGVNPGYMTKEQIGEMKEAGMEFGSHTLSHPDLRYLSPEELKRQLEVSKQDMKVFCYPAGKYNDEVKKAVRAAGYIAAVTIHNGIANQDSDLLELPRIRITNETDFEKLLP